MTDRFDRCLDVVIGFEGGFVCDPRDPAGATNMGITIGTLGQWFGRVATADEVRDLTRETAADIYRGRYWFVDACERLPAGVDLMMFDCAVNQGVSFAARTLQQSVGVSPDGLIGPRTLAAAQSDSASRLVSSISSLRGQRYRSLPTFAVFGKGWLRRLDAVTALALTDAAA